jgi:hypothetical protein
MDRVAGLDDRSGDRREFCPSVRRKRTISGRPVLDRMRACVRVGFMAGAAVDLGGARVTADLMGAVRDTDQALTRHPTFGDSTQILARVLGRYRFGVQLFAERLPEVAARLQAIERLRDGEARRIFLDPVVRVALEAGFSDLEAGALASPHRLEEILPLALEALPLGLSELGMRKRWCIAAADPKWMWDVVGRDDPHSAALRRAFAGMFAGDGGSHGRLLSPDADSRERVEEAVALLSAVLPDSGAGALRHIEAIALLDASAEGGTVMSGASGEVTPSTVFLSLDRLGNPWDIAGSLLHEGLHLKLFDAAQAVALTRAPGEMVQVPWRDVRWTSVRAVFAYHVYVHQNLFKAAALSPTGAVVARFGHPSTYATRPHAMSVVQNDETARFGRAIDRTLYLGQQLATSWSHLLTPAGHELVRWLTACFAPIERAWSPQPKPAGVREVHRRAAHLRTQPVERAGCLMVFSPAAGRLQWLDLNAWLIFELCDGRSSDELERAYLEAVGDENDGAEARRQLRAGLQALVASGLVTRETPTATEAGHEERDERS